VFAVDLIGESHRNKLQEPITWCRLLGSMRLASNTRTLVATFRLILTVSMSVAHNRRGSKQGFVIGYACRLNLADDDGVIASR